VATALRERIASAPATVLGPAPLFRLRGRARTQLLIKTTERAATIESVGRAVDRIASAAVKREVSISVDVDPQ
jgi:primosomal protein N' (replication factor Y)